MPYEDSIHPYPLAFDPPLIEHTTGEGNGFVHHWEKLNYAFALPNPAQFPSLPVLTDDDRVLLDRFVAVCRQLAGYSAINNDSGITISGKDGQSNIELQFPSAEAFGGTSLAFRQLHSGQEDASFDKVQGRLFQAIRILPEKEQQPAKDFLQQWVSARGKLMNQLLQTIVRRKGSPAPSARPKHRVQLLQYQPAGADTHSSTATPFTSPTSARSSRTCWMNEANQAYYKHAVLLAISGLSHFYFGFALLLEAAATVESAALRCQPQRTMRPSVFRSGKSPSDTEDLRQPLRDKK